MNSNTIFHGLRIGCVLCATVVAAALSGAAHAGVRGELWENTTTMESKHGSMALGAVQECHAVNWFDDGKFEPKGEGGCRNTDIKRSGDGYRWKISCADGRQGTASVRKNGRDRIDTDLTMDTPDGHFVLHVKSRRIGSCATPGESDE